MKNSVSRNRLPSRARKTSRLIPAVLRPGNAVLVFIQEAMNRVFNPWLNPMYYLGAISFFLIWIILGTGVYLYFLYDMNPGLAFESVQYITREQQYYGGIVRSLHRYASDGLVITILMHIIQVFFSDRFRRYRWVAWISGAIVLPLVIFEGWSGYLMVWDQSGQIVAVYTTQILDALRLTVEPMSMNFIKGELNANFFFILTFLHLTLPMVMLVVSWIHCMRIARPLINPPRPVALTIGLALIALCLAKPAVSMAKADLATLVGKSSVDWFYLLPFPLMHAYAIPPSSLLVWGSLLFLLFSLMPWIIPEPRKRTDNQAVIRQASPGIDGKECTGCLLCLEVCPFEALNVVTVSDDRPSEKIVSVSPERCSECGFCVTACEFSAASMDGQTKSSFQAYIENLLSSPPAGGRDRPGALAFVCERSLDLDSFLNERGDRPASNDGIAAVIIPCIGVISPAMVECAMKAGAKGVAVIGCRQMDCHYRETRRRIRMGDQEGSGRFLVEEMDDPRFKTFFVSRFDVLQLVREIDGFVEVLEKTTPEDAS